MKKKKYSLYEAETIINFNEAEITANISTRSSYWIHHLDRLAERSPGEVTIVFSPDGYREYTVPQKWVKVLLPHRFSKEERQRRSELIKAFHERRRTEAAERRADDDYLDFPPPPHTDADCPTGPYTDFYCPYDD